MLRLLISFLLVFACSSAFGIDTSTCGYLACEAAIPGNIDPLPPPAREDECREGPAPKKKIEDWYRVWCVNCPDWSAWYYSGTSWAQCNCSAQPPIPAGDAFATTESGNAYCNAGCQYVVDGPGICWGAPNGGGSRVCTVAVVPSGVNCNPLKPTPPPTPPPDGTECFSGADGKQVCLTPLVPPPPALPEICGTRGGDSLGCVTPPDCVGTEAGSLCAGEPVPSPDPVGDPPADFPEPDVSVSVTYCSGAGSCSEIHVESSGPPDSPPPEPCPEGTHREGSGCVSSPRCPDGSSPVGGTCAAPPGGCPDGTTPVDGRCAASGGGEPGSTGCPEGEVDVGGTCYGLCGDGSVPVGGTCPASPGRCPNGAEPVDGRCSVGVPCDPETQECGSGDNAGGGDTCGAPPFCGGDIIACAVLNQTWMARCASERAFGNQGPGGDPIGELTDAANGEVWQEGDPDEGSGGLDDSGYGLPRVCPSVPDFQVMGQTLSIPPVWCDLLASLRYLLMLGALWSAVKIAGG